jgi:hypothetical protein
MEKKTTFELVSTPTLPNISRFIVSVKKDELRNCVKKPKLEIMLENEKTYTNEEIFHLFSRIGYYKDGNDVDDPLTFNNDHYGFSSSVNVKTCNHDMMNTLYKHYNLSLSQIKNVICLDLPYVSLLNGLNVDRIKEELTFYVNIDKNSDLCKNINKLNLLFTVDDIRNINETKLYEILSPTEDDYNNNRIIKNNGFIFKEETLPTLN